MIYDLITASEMPLDSVPNMLLAVLWASQANTVPTAMWTVGFLLLPENRKYLDSIRSSILGDSKNAKTPKIEGAVLSGKQLERLVEMACDADSLLTRCCMEALRLRSASTDVRIAATDIVIPVNNSNDEHNGNGNDGGGDGGEENEISAASSDGKMNTSSAVFITKGTMVMICPYLSHTDPRLYENPGAFDPGRVGASLPGAQNRNVHSAAAGVGGLAGLAFGGGKFRCPGRAFAEMELGVTAGLILAGLDVKLDINNTNWRSDGDGDGGVDVQGSAGDPKGLLPPPDITKLVGIKVPAGPCWVKVRRRRV